MSNLLKPTNLNLAVAEKIMKLVSCDGWKETNLSSAGGAVGDSCTHERGTCYPRLEINNIHGKIGGVPDYSTNPNRMMDVIGEMLRRDYGWNFHTDGSGWIVEVFPLPDTGYHGIKTAGTTLPETICYAALKMLDKEQQ